VAEGAPLTAVDLLPGPGWAVLTEAWLDEDEADRLFAAVRREAAWTQEQIRIAGRVSPVPRLTAWHADPGVAYAYSGVRHQPIPWTPALTQIRERVEGAARQTFNGVLANLYRDGRDSVGWHADDEAELTGSAIASVSLGAPRRFVFRMKDRPTRKVDTVLPPGSLLIMDAVCQRHWHHSIPKTTVPVGPRINLTFRRL
jgi:alkylated DNA repair dioxygenase AlkB